MAHGVHSGIMSLTVSDRETVTVQLIQIWIFATAPHYRGAESSADASALAIAGKRWFRGYCPIGFPPSITPQLIRRRWCMALLLLYMVSELIRQWSETGEGVVIHTPAYDAFYKAIEGNQRTVMPVALREQAYDWFCDMASRKLVGETRM